MKVCVYIATSLDGFIARENGRLDWLPGAEGVEDTMDTKAATDAVKPKEAVASGEANLADGDLGFSTFFESIDVLVMGRNTYDFVRNAGPWPYKGKRVIVLSRTLDKNQPHNIEVQSGFVEDLFRDLQVSGANRVYVDGGQTIQGFLKQGLIHEITITTIPVLIGQGIPLFGPVLKDIHLNHVETISYSSGFVQSKYEVLP
ncbi:MAG: dihydrofolate reductase family protein [Leptospirales bacterium]